MLRVTLRGSGIRPVVLCSGESVVFGRAPHQGLSETDLGRSLHASAVVLPRCAAHVSRLLGELCVGAELVRLRWHGSTEAQLSSLFDAPGGARRVTLAAGMAALLDEGENHLVVLRGRQLGVGDSADLQLVLDVVVTDAEPVPTRSRSDMLDADAAVTAPAPTLAPDTREWFVALALSEPWLTGTDDYPRPSSNREIYERIRGWLGHAWNLDRSQRVDDAIRAVSRVAFGPRGDPFSAGGRAQNVRFAVGRRAAEVRLVTVEDLERVESVARNASGQ